MFNEYRLVCYKAVPFLRVTNNIWLCWIFIPNFTLVGWWQLDFSFSRPNLAKEDRFNRVCDTPEWRCTEIYPRNGFWVLFTWWWLSVLFWFSFTIPSGLSFCRALQLRTPPLQWLLAYMSIKTPCTLVPFYWMYLAKHSVEIEIQNAANVPKTCQFTKYNVFCHLTRLQWHFLYDYTAVTWIPKECDGS
jgi:hypothetical protein